MSNAMLWCGMAVAQLCRTTAISAVVSRPIEFKAAAAAEFCFVFFVLLNCSNKNVFVFLSLVNDEGL